jgi:predicted transposase YdaD
LERFWKLALLEFFGEFIAFFLPELVDKIDWDKPVESLDEEFQELFPEQVAVNRLDKLIKVILTNGELCYSLIHIEIQGYADTDFPKRMFQYFTKISAHYDLPIVSFALITEPLVHIERLGVYQLPSFGIVNIFRYYVWQPAQVDMETLLSSKNVFGLIAAALKQMASESKAVLSNRVVLIRRIFAALESLDYGGIKIQLLFLFLRKILKLTPIEAAEMKQILVKTKSANPVLGLLHDPEVADFYKEELEIIRKESRIEGEAKGRIEGEAKGRIEGEAKGRIEGEETGAYNAKLQTAKKLKALGVDPQLIAQATELELSIIQNL